MTLDFENLDDFLDITEFAQAVQVGPLGSEVTINAVFENAHFTVDEGVSGFSTTQPAILCKSTDIEDYSQGSRVVVGGTEYEIVDIRPDGTGMSEVQLHLA